MKTIAVVGIAASMALPHVTQAAGHERSTLSSGATSYTVRTDLGMAQSTTRVRLAVVLRYRNEAALRRLTATQPGALGGNTRRPLSAQGFRSSYAPSQATYLQTVAALERHGLRIEKTYANRTVIDVSGSPAVIGTAFATQIDAVRDRDGAMRYANTRPVSIPVDLRQRVYGVTGFDARHNFTPAFQRATHPIVTLGPAKGAPLQGPDTGFSPTAYAKAYNFPAMHGVAGGSKGARYDGSGEGAAIVIDADYLDTDLTTYLKYFQITPTGPPLKKIFIQGGPTPGLSRDSVETMLDIDTILGTSPGVALSIYELNALEYAQIIDAYNQIDTDDTVGAVNSSFGGCETQTEPSYFPQLADYLALQGAALGITYAASTGDTGVFVCNNGYTPDGVETPASSPTFVAVGGTTLFFDPGTAGYRFELGWTGSGGGVSAIFPTPPYQQNVPGVIGATRNVPDFAFAADPGTGESMYIGGQWYGPVGGTSLASPLFVGLATQLAQYHAKLLGDPHEPIYAAFLSDGYSKPVGHAIFHDITIGQNGYYNAVAGYDLVTGIGSINGWNFAATVQF